MRTHQDIKRTLQSCINDAHFAGIPAAAVLSNQERTDWRNFDSEIYPPMWTLEVGIHEMLPPLGRDGLRFENVATRADFEHYCIDKHKAHGGTEWDFIKTVGEFVKGNMPKGIARPWCLYRSLLHWMRHLDGWRWNESTKEWNRVGRRGESPGGQREKGT